MCYFEGFLFPHGPIKLGKHSGHEECQSCVQEKKKKISFFFWLLAKSVQKKIADDADWDYEKRKFAISFFFCVRWAGFVFFKTILTECQRVGSKVNVNIYNCVVVNWSRDNDWFRRWKANFEVRIYRLFVIESLGFLLKNFKAESSLPKSLRQRLKIWFFKILEYAVRRT